MLTLTAVKGQAVRPVPPGFVTTGWVVTITLSASYATAHIVENPFWPASFGHSTATLKTIPPDFGRASRGGLTEGFSAIGIAVITVVAYLALNLVVVAVGFYEIFADPRVLADWQTALFANHGDPFPMLGAAVVVFPLLALGLSGFETGVGMMPLVRGEPDDDPGEPAGRIRTTRKLLAVAAVTMCFHLITTSFVTTMLIPVEEAGPALGEPMIVARATTKRHAKVLGRVGTDRVIQPEWEMGEQVARVLAAPAVLDYVDLGEDEALIEAHVPRQWEGKSLAELSLSRNLSLTIVAHKPQGGVGSLPTGDTVLGEGDLIVGGGSKETLDASPLSGPLPGRRR